MNRGNADIALPDTNFKRDIIHIQKELNRPIAILFDECDVLIHSRTHLQKLRNIFMNTPGFMLVITGTPTLFPIIDEVFSPIIRQFKKINIGPFNKEDDTEDCIKKPLEKIGIKHPGQIFDFETFTDVSEIHNLTGGRPYEIQLLCHFLFRRVQEGRAKRMKLTVDLLDDVLEELDTLQDVSARPVVNAVRNLDKQQLSALETLCRCSDHVSFEQVWFSEYVFWGQEDWTRESLQDQCQALQELGIIRVEDDIIHFVGDDFDRIYCKYLARKYKVNLSIENMPYELLLGVHDLDTYLAINGLEDILSSAMITSGKLEKLEIQHLSAAMLDPNSEDDPFQSSPAVSQELYWSSIEFRNQGSFRSAIVTITTPWTTVRRWFRCQDFEINGCVLDNLEHILNAPSERAAILGGNIEIDSYDLPVIPIDTLVREVKLSDNSRAKLRLSRRHLMEMLTTYFEEQSAEDACFHGELAHQYNPTPDIGMCQ